MSGSLRDQIVALIKPALPTGWRFIPNRKIPKTIGVITVILQMTEIRPVDEAPFTHLANTVTVTVISPSQDDAKADNDLADHVLSVISALQKAAPAWLKFDSARFGKATDTYLGWEINLTAITNNLPKE